MEAVASMAEKVRITHCKYCKKEISKSNRKRHEENCSLNARTAGQSFRCDLCYKSFKRNDYLKAHLKKCAHSKEYVPMRTLLPCNYAECGLKYSTLSELVDHLQSFHSAPVADSETLIFQNENYFLGWKVEEEARTFSYFSKKCGDHVSDEGLVKYFYCQRHGSEKAHRKKDELDRKTGRRVARGRTKTGKICISSMKATYLKDGPVTVVYQPTHSHPLNPSSTRFHQSISSIDPRHSRGLELPDQSIKPVFDDMWEISSVTQPDKVLQVTCLEKQCNYDLCFCKCNQCPGLCAHLYHCTCEDSDPLCKHIHKVHSFLTRDDPIQHVETVLRETEESFFSQPVTERGQVTYTVGMNEMGDLSREEIVSKRNGYRSPATRNGEEFDLDVLESSLPATVDWRKKGAVTPIKNQGSCGSCWAFSTTGSVEGQHFLSTKKLVSLSEQNLMDCSDSEGNEGCDGGLMDDAFEYIIKNKGIDTEKSYPYQGEDESCRYKAKNKGATISSYVDVTSGSESALQKAVAKIGPVSVAMDASLDSFNFYTSGIYSSPDCSSTDLDHGVLAIGYGTLKSKKYWLVKNSWGTSWGIKGYFMLARDDNNMCGIATEASYPVV